MYINRPLQPVRVVSPLFLILHTHGKETRKQAKKQKYIQPYIKFEIDEIDSVEVFIVNQVNNKSNQKRTSITISLIGFAVKKPFAVTSAKGNCFYFVNVLATYDRLATRRLSYIYTYHKHTQTNAYLWVICYKNHPKMRG